MSDSGRVRASKLGPTLANRSFTLEAVEQFMPLEVSMLAAAGLPDTFWEKSQTASKKKQAGQKKPNR